MAFKPVPATWLGALALAVATLFLAPTQAHACGGFFCSLQQPVNQAGERILFAVDGTEVTAHIQIQYQGTAEDFSWVMPLPEVPDFNVGSDQIFNALIATTSPQFQINWELNGCDAFRGCDIWRFDNAAGGGPVPTAAPENDDGVNVLAEGQIGSFEYQVIEGESGRAIFNWLNDNGYDQPPSSQGLLERYQAEGFVFVGLKLKKNSDAGEIQPIVLKYEDPMLACVPIRLTAIAANNDMPIFAWVLSSARAIPMNYFHVVLNADAFDWFRCAMPTGDVAGFGFFNSECNQAYLDLVTRATDAVDGKGFVTEYAGTSSVMDNMIFRPGQFDTSQLSTITNPDQFLNTMLGQGFPSDGIVQSLIRQYIPLPDDPNAPEDCRDERSFYNWNLANCLQYMPAGWTFDPVAFANDLEERVVAPLRDGQALFTKHPYLTRMFTTMSADEMDRDPIFSFNPQLPNVSNVHEVKAVPMCRRGSTTEADRVQLTFANGAQRTYSGRVDPNTCQFVPSGRPSTPAAVAAVQVLNESGAAENVDLDDPNALAMLDNRIATRVPSGHSAAQDPNTIDDGTTGTFDVVGDAPGQGGGSGGGCSVARGGDTGGSEWPIAGLFLMLGMVVRRRLKSEG